MLNELWMFKPSLKTGYADENAPDTSSNDENFLIFISCKVRSSWNSKVMKFPNSPLTESLNDSKSTSKVLERVQCCESTPFQPSHHLQMSQTIITHHMNAPPKPESFNRIIFQGTRERFRSPLKSDYKRQWLNKVAEANFVPISLAFSLQRNL